MNTTCFSPMWPGLNPPRTGITALHHGNFKFWCGLGYEKPLKPQKVLRTLCVVWSSEFKSFNYKLVGCGVKTQGMTPAGVSELFPGKPMELDTCQAFQINWTAPKWHFEKLSSLSSFTHKHNRWELISYSFLKNITRHQTYRLPYLRDLTLGSTQSSPGYQERERPGFSWLRPRPPSVHSAPKEKHSVEKWACWTMLHWWKPGIQGVNVNRLLWFYVKDSASFWYCVHVLGILGWSKKVWFLLDDAY